MQRKAYKITRFSRKKKIKRGEKEEFGGKKEAHTEVLQLARTGRWFSLPSTGVSAFHWDARGGPHPWSVLGQEATAVPPYPRPRRWRTAVWAAPALSK